MSESRPPLPIRVLSYRRAMHCVLRPYVPVEEAARDIVAAVLFLDDTRLGNGALRVLPGSHLRGPAPRRPTNGACDPSLADPARLDTRGEIAIEVPAGSLLLFGSLLVHRSSPNESGAQRRALLFSHQPAGRSDMQRAVYRPELLQRLPWRVAEQLPTRRF